MKNLTNLDKLRITTGPIGSDSDPKFGAFQIPMGTRRMAYVIADNGEISGWEHVSVHMKTSTIKGKISQDTPTWDEMCRIKDMFWDGDDTVIQYHPAGADYVNLHEHVLHLWRPTKDVIPTPPIELV